MEDQRTFSIVSLAALHEFLAQSRSSLWFGALSFEQRCSGSLIALQRAQIRITRGVLLNYDTNIRLSIEAEQQRNSNWGDITELSENVFASGIGKRSVAAYGFMEFQEKLEQEVWAADVDLVVFDITCLTKIHTLALAASLPRCPRPVRWALAYTIPENYASLGEAPDQSPGWADIIVAPLGETASLFNEASGRGVIIPGHEADRLVVGLAEIEPAGGLIAIAETRQRPDLRHISERRNQTVIRQLTRMRASNWVKHLVGVTALSSMMRLVRDEIKKARAHRAPVILFPYGPKPLLFVSAFVLAGEYPEASWFVYPIPWSYDVPYSEGNGGTLWVVPT
ncbi:MAG: hypothetical protein ACE5JU_16750 [Candidatus Binatia bacterium]